MYIYISTHFLTSQPTLIKLDNENIGGHLTPLHRWRQPYMIRSTDVSVTSKPNQIWSLRLFLTRASKACISARRRRKMQRRSFSHSFVVLSRSKQTHLHAGSLDEQISQPSTSSGASSSLWDDYDNPVETDQPTSVASDTDYGHRTW